MKFEGENFGSFIFKDEYLRDMFWVLPIVLLAIFFHYNLEHNSIYRMIMALILLGGGVYFIFNAFKKAKPDENEDEKIEKRKIFLPLFLLILASIFAAKSFQGITGRYFSYIMLILGIIFVISEFYRRKKIKGNKNFGSEFYYVSIMVFVMLCLSLLQFLGM
jgi:amino acid permease